MDIENNHAAVNEELLDDAIDEDAIAFNYAIAVDVDAAIAFNYAIAVDVDAAIAAAPESTHATVEEAKVETNATPKTS